MNEIDGMRSYGNKLYSLMDKISRHKGLQKTDVIERSNLTTNVMVSIRKNQTIFYLEKYVLLLTILPK